MSKANNLKDFLVDLANAIREKKNKTGAINPQDFSAEIKSIVAGDVQMPNVSGTLVITEWITEEDYEALKQILGNNITIDAQGGIYIHFEDPEVLRVLLAKGVGNGTGITTAQAEAVTSIGTWFNRNTVIESFDELEKFKGVTTLKDSSFMGCTSLKSIKLNNITTCERYALRNCTSLTIEVNMPNLTGTLYSVFSGSGITKVVNLGQVTKIEGYNNENNAFAKCLNLTEAILPDTLETIGAYAFYGCTALTTVDMSNVTSIGNDAFYGCTVLTSFVSRAATPPTLGAAAFTKTPIASGTGYIYVPDASVEAYKTATNWSAYADRINPMSVYEQGGAAMITKYDRLIGDSSDYVVLPIVYKAGWSYKWSVKSVSELITNDTTGILMRGGIDIYCSSYKEMRIDGFSNTIWSGYFDMETLEFTPIGVNRNGVSISTEVITSDKTDNIRLFEGDYRPTMGNFVHFRSLEVWDSEGTLIHKYVPCKLGNSVGLFDDVLHTFVPSANNTLSVENDV